MSNPGRGTGLQTIFSIFLGLILTAFFGVGVYTFYPTPEADVQAEIDTSFREAQAIRNERGAGELTPRERDRIQELTDERNALVESEREDREAWGRTTSIILIILATATMAVSLGGAERLPVISNGLLLGGVFTMLYGVGWIIATDTSFARFFVMTAALAITLALGYVRFVRQQPPESAHGPAVGKDLEAIDQRLRRIEDRIRRVGSVLGEDE